MRVFRLPPPCVRVAQATIVALLLVTGGGAAAPAQEKTPAAAEPAAKPAPTDPGALYEVEEVRDLVYHEVAGESLKLNLFKPKVTATTDGAPSPRFPGVVWVHGGGWMGGDYNSEAKQARLTATRGYVAISIGYRLLPKHPFPACIADVKTAVRWLRAHAAEHRLDPTRVAAVGASAGGHLVALLGTSDANAEMDGDGPYAEQSSRVQCVVSICGVHDFTRPNFASAPIIWQFLGGRLEEKRATYELASPIHHVTADDPPTLLIHGTADILVPIIQSRLMLARLKEAGVEAELLEVEGADHGFSRGAKQALSKEAITERVFEFVGRHFTGEGAARPAPATGFEEF
ncbi:MAG: alpha/beta hydrolase [Planctomycetes bacterium]|nr:alpha/beta hydrolase [Planctomycetota bacterium]